MLLLVNMHLAERLLLIKRPTKSVDCIIPEDGAKKMLHLRLKHLSRMQATEKRFVPAISVVGLV